MTDSEPSFRREVPFEISFDDLPIDPTGPPGNAWGRFGKDDQLGMLNLLTPETVIRAAQEIQTGIRVSIDWPLDKPKYAFFRRQSFKREFVNRKKGDEPRVVNDDFLSFNTQTSTQWDGFRHFGNNKYQVYYNNKTHEDIVQTDILGISAWSTSGGIVGRGVLLDYESWAREHDISITPFESVSIPLDHLLQLVAEYKITFLPADILLIRTGFTTAYQKLSDQEQKALADRSSANFAGIESSEATLRFLWNNQFAAVASDSPAVEKCPVQSCDYTLHEWLLCAWGMPIGELFDLNAISELCKHQKRWTFFFSSMPLKVPGGVASPACAMAIF